MKNLPGVFKAQKKNGDIYYRSSITFRSKHISLGSFDNEEDANAAYNDATAIIQSENTYLCLLYTSILFFQSENKVFLLHHNICFRPY